MVYDTTTLHQNFNISILIFLALFRVEQSDDPKGTFLKIFEFQMMITQTFALLAMYGLSFKAMRLKLCIHPPLMRALVLGLRGRQLICVIWGVKKSCKEAFFEVVT